MLCQWAHTVSGLHELPCNYTGLHNCPQWSGPGDQVSQPCTKFFVRWRSTHTPRLSVPRFPWKVSSEFRIASACVIREPRPTAVIVTEAHCAAKLAKFMAVADIENSCQFNEIGSSFHFEELLKSWQTGLLQSTQLGMMAWSSSASRYSYTKLCTGFRGWIVLLVRIGPWSNTLASLDWNPPMHHMTVEDIFHSVQDISIRYSTLICFSTLRVYHYLSVLSVNSCIRWYYLLVSLDEHAATACSFKRRASSPFRELLSLCFSLSVMDSPIMMA